MSPANAKGCPRMRTEFTEAVYAWCLASGTTARASAFAWQPPPSHSDCTVLSKSPLETTVRVLSVPSVEVEAEPAGCGSTPLRTTPVVQSLPSRCTYSSHSLAEKSIRSCRTDSRSRSAMQ
eukprot:3320737-Rhodomonas_salina.1